jgi:hypothetical protein
MNSVLSSKAIIKMTGTTECFKGKLKLWMTQLIKSVPAHYQSVQNQGGGTFDTPVYSV